MTNTALEAIALLSDKISEKRYLTIIFASYQHVIAFCQTGIFCHQVAVQCGLETIQQPILALDRQMPTISVCISGNTSRCG